MLIIDFEIDSQGSASGARGALFVVDPATGARTVLTDFNSGANPGNNPSGVAVRGQMPAIRSTPPILGDYHESEEDRVGSCG